MRAVVVLLLALLAGCGDRAAPPPPDPLERDIDTASQWISDALESSGYRGDFSVTSVVELDRFFTEQMRRAGVAKPGGVLEDDLGPKLWAIGAYVGTVLEREYGARWRLEGVERDEDIALELADGSTVWPVRRVIERFENGIEDSIGVYVLRLREA